MTTCAASMGGLPIVIVHGGSVNTSAKPVHLIHDGVKNAAKVGYKVLLKTSCVLNAVEAAINVLEEDPTFNAGRGSALNEEGRVEMEACIMEGTRMRSGSVALVDSVLHPISLARRLMKTPDCVFLAGKGASGLAKSEGFYLVDEGELHTPSMDSAFQEYRSANGRSCGCHTQDTVGCVVVDWKGRVASGCSTGGPIGKIAGRIGDAPLPGCGTYCDDSIGAVSCTGHGESLLQHNLAHRILCQMKKGMPPEDATIRELCCLGRRYGAPGGAIAVSRSGEVGIGFTTDRFAWACQHGGLLHYGYEPGQNIVDILSSPHC